MKKIVRLSEAELKGIIKKVISEKVSKPKTGNTTIQK